MGLGDTDLSDEKGAAHAGGTAPPTVSSPGVSCSICLDGVNDGGDRSTAKLQCGHQFHLDCIGSAFNAKGVMQCPNCRKIEKGNWLYANGYCSFPDFSIEDWPHDVDFYDFTYPEMPYGLHWCPFSRLARVPTSFEEGDSSPPVTYNDLLGHHAFFAEHPANPSAAHSCPYVAYFQPLQPSSSSGSQVSTESTIDGSTFHHHWSSISGSVDGPPPHGFPGPEVHYHGWDSHSTSYSMPVGHSSGSEQTPASASMRGTRFDSDAHPRPGSFLHPFIIGHGSASRASSSGISSMIPPFVGGARGHSRIRELHAYQRQNGPGIHGPVFSASRRSGNMRSLASVGPGHSQSEPAGFYLVTPPAPPPSRSPPDAEPSGGNHFYAWERDRFAPFPLSPVERDLHWWGPLSQPSGASDSSSRPAVWTRPSSDRSSSQTRHPHAPRMHPFI